MNSNDEDMAVCQNLVPLVNIKIAGKWMFITLKMVLIGIDPYPHLNNNIDLLKEFKAGRINHRAKWTVKTS